MSFHKYQLHRFYQCPKVSGLALRMHRWSKTPMDPRPRSIRRKKGNLQKKLTVKKTCSNLTSILLGTLKVKFEQAISARLKPTKLAKSKRRQMWCHVTSWSPTCPTQQASEHVSFKNFSPRLHRGRKRACKTLTSKPTIDLFRYPGSPGSTKVYIKFSS